jgi:type IV pilus assembly protein PilE
MDFRSLHRRMRGITLIELLTVIIILGVLASIAVPTYRRYLIRSQRTEAKIALLQLQTAQEKYYSQYNRYTDKVTAKSTATTPGLGLPGTTETGKYVVSVINLGAGGQTYTGIAAPAIDGGQADDKDCGAFMINERGVRSNSWKGSPKNAQTCWK